MGRHTTSNEGTHTHNISITIPSKTSTAVANHAHIVSGSSKATGDTETRPVNKMLYAIIKATNS
jgi:hypothetical protein